ncbi:MAG: LysR family transcriptional regulator [Roseibium sp.]|uniref:LysR family transcriptional regulator n=1 Tax=Roseibium sp. TaxID=1936156 RepID=UPI0026163658|nr:LysR family transcriptional regulator [Roseibium sp.]MCV0428140.1 LysR family transcriptional regulator [Roseibium sp.]
MLDDLALFVRIAQNRSLSATARQLNVPPATVTRRLRKLEEQVGAQLVHRSARKFSLTSEGEAYYEAFADLIHQAEVSLRGLSADLHDMRGRLRVAAPTNISVGMLEPMWSAFLKSYPEIQLTLLLSNENKDLLENRIDLALRIGPQTDLRLYQKRLGRVATMLVASPGYLAKTGVPERPEDLKSHKLIWVSSLPHWQLKNMDTGEEATQHLTANIAVDDIGLACQFSADGHGIALLPVTETSKKIVEGNLQFVMPQWQGQGREAYAVWPTGRLLSARAKCLRDYMESYMAERPVFQGALPV